MSAHDRPLLIAVLDPFRTERPRTLRGIASELNVSEEAALSGLATLEGMNVLERARTETGTPVWTPRRGADRSLPTV